MNCDGDVEKQWFYKKKFIDKLKHSEVAIQTDKANEQHYEVPTEFFTTVRRVLTTIRRVEVVSKPTKVFFFFTLTGRHP